MQKDRSCCSEIEAVEELVEKNGLSVLSARDEWGYTPAHWAALDGNIEVSSREIRGDSDPSFLKIIV